MEYQTITKILKDGIEAYKGETIKIEPSDGFELEFELGKPYYIVECIEKVIKPRKAVISSIEINGIAPLKDDKTPIHTNITFVAIEGNKDDDHPDIFESDHIAYWADTYEECIAGTKDIHDDMEAEGEFDE